MQPMWCYAGNPVDLDDTKWRITPVDTNAKDSLNPEALHGGRHRCRPAASRGQLRASGSTGWGLAEAVQVHNLCSLPGLSGSVHSPSASRVSTLGKWALFTHRARRLGLSASQSQNDPGWASTLCVAVPTGWCTLLSTSQPPPLGEKRLVSSVQVLAVKFVQSSAAQETGKPVRHRIYPSEMSTAHTSTTHAARVRRQGSDLLPKHLVSSGPLHAGRRPRRPRRRETGSKRGAGRRRVFRVRVYFSFFLATALPLRTSTFSLPRTFLTLVLRSLRALRARPEGCLDQAIGIENERLLISYL